MAYQKYILPLFISSKLVSQNSTDSAPTIEFGFTHSTYVNFCFHQPEFESLQKKETKTYDFNLPIQQCQYGYAIGFFLWLPINQTLTLKPQIDMTFSNLAIRCIPRIYAKVYDIGFSPGFAIALKPQDPNGIIYLARNMSCYLTAKQPYLLVGPKLDLKKYDRGFINKGFQNELVLGAFIGYGINYEFHGTNFAPEIKYCVESVAQNSIKHAKKLSHTLSVAINIF